MSVLVYLHGFASGPAGHKAAHCRAWAAAHGVAFHAPDLNLPSFEALTFSAQVAAVEALLAALPEPPVLPGASLGGVVAAAVAHRGRCRLRGLVLLAPAFGFARRRLLGRRWEGYRRRGRIRVFHHGSGAWCLLGPALLADLPAWADDEGWRLGAPLWVLHGRRDESVPLDLSEAFVRRHPGSRMCVLDDDHALLAPGSLAALDAALAEAFGLSPGDPGRAGRGAGPDPDAAAPGGGSTTP